MRRSVARDSKENRRGRGYTIPRSSIRIADVDGEEFEETGPGTVLGGGNNRRQHHPALRAEDLSSHSYQNIQLIQLIAG